MVHETMAFLTFAKATNIVTKDNGYYYGFAITEDEKTIFFKQTDGKDEIYIGGVLHKNGRNIRRGDKIVGQTQTTEKGDAFVWWIGSATSIQVFMRSLQKGTVYKTLNDDFTMLIKLLLYYNFKSIRNLNDSDALQFVFRTAIFAKDIKMMQMYERQYGKDQLWNAEYLKKYLN